jgi:RNA polymerase sigma factor (sigma-70 family)
MKGHNVEELITPTIVKFLKGRVTKIVRKNNWFWVKDVDDVVQESLLSFIKANDKGLYIYQGDAKLRGFLVKTAVFYMMSLQKKEIRNREYNYVVSDEDSTPLVEVAIAPTNESSDERDAFFLALEKLNPRRKEVIMKILDGLKVRDICRETGATPAAVSGLKFNAIKDLKQILKHRGFTVRGG